VEPTAPDHYAALGLDRRCTTQQVREAFRLLARRHHPDANGGSAEAEPFRAIHAAYAILSDPARRRAYDRELGGGASPAAPARGEKIERNIRHDVHLRIEDFFRGATLEVRVNDPANPGGPETYPLAVPPETAPGTRFRIARAAPFEGGRVEVRVRPMPGARFKVRGSDLRCDLRIQPRRAADGGAETIPGPTGAPLRVPIPRGAGRGEIVRIAGAGLPRSRGGRGDLLVRLTYRPEVRATRTTRGPAPF
jgi:curved DNA-binding protein